MQNDVGEMQQNRLKSNLCIVVVQIVRNDIHLLLHSFSIIRHRYLVLTRIHGTANSLFAVLDGHGPNGHIIAEYGKNFLSSDQFLHGLIALAKKADQKKESAYTTFFKTEMRRLDESLGKVIDFEDIRGNSGTTIALAYIDSGNYAVHVGIGDSSVIGLEKNSYKAIYLCTHHKPVS